MILIFLGDWWDALSGVQQIFWGISIVFSILFLIQFVLSLIGLDFDSDTDVDAHIHTDMSSDTDYSLDPSFTLFSVRSIIAFFTFFGWTGVMVLNSGGSTYAAIGFAALSGFAAMFVVGYMMYMFSKLSEEGKVDVKEALYNTGEVYLPIPANKNGTGKIHIKVSGTLREVEAVTDGDAIPTGSSVKVVDVLNDNVLLVEPKEKLLLE